MDSPASLFRDRTDAGQQLATHLQSYVNDPDVLVLGLPRGGVPVAFEVAKALNAPLDICLVRKLGVPDQPELAMGAIATGGTRVLNEDIIAQKGITDETLQAVTAQELEELQRRDLAYRGNHDLPVIRDRIIIVVDDGAATGATLHAAILALRHQQPRKLVVAVPVIAKEACSPLSAVVEELVYVKAISPLYAIGMWYRNFSQTTDQEVQTLLAQALRTGATDHFQLGRA
jgi:putative phosphoribosyl transferase